MHSIGQGSNFGFAGIEGFALDREGKKSVGTGAERKVKSVALECFKADFVGHFAVFERIAVAFDTDLAVLVGVEQPTAGLDCLLRAFAVAYVVPAGHELAPV